METIKPGARGPAVEDIQDRLFRLGLLDAADITGVFDPKTVEALQRFCEKVSLPVQDEVNAKVWSALVDATYQLGDRTLYLRMPNFHGNDVLQLQQALGALGFDCGYEDGIFGAHTELALRKFQMNMGLPSEGIAGAYTYEAINHLHHSWEGKGPSHHKIFLGFARAADVLESNAICLFGTDDFTREVASRMSNLSQATNPISRIVSADALSVPPDDEMLLVHVLVKGDQISDSVPSVDASEDDDTFGLRIHSAISIARESRPPRIAIILPGTVWEDAGRDRSAQHYAILLLDGLCSALTQDL